MQIIDTLEKIDDKIKGCCLTIGNFDGVHLGHRKIIASAAGLAVGPVVAMTFDPHPVVILHPEKEPQVLTPLPLKAALLEAAGVDYLIVVKDSYKLLTLSPADFVDDFLMKTVKPKAVIEGDDFHFGYGRSGNAEVLAALGKDRNFDVIIVAPQQVKLSGSTEKVSSTLIRHLLHAGDAANAAKTLGRNYRLMGKVIKGRGKGTHLGFPTANIEPHQQVVPAEGVYAGFVSVAQSVEELCTSDEKIPAVFSLGRAKTFISDHPLLIEAHILDEKVEDLYDKYLAMDFVDFLRGQQRFETEEKLKEQITADCKKTENILSNEKK
ncbi:MAG: bifunctional riboflavin kinase/FAD synthetase [Sedimentisphaerales bacterium]|nr:bifunctional riboflavin kinase/FAD synthetase [Sedimentisphaerales bacterium]